MENKNVDLIEVEQGIVNAGEIKQKKTKKMLIKVY